MDDFRFEKLDIWKEAIELSDTIFDYAYKSGNKKLFKLTEQLRAFIMSITNNIT
jgi:hypothetical protein